MKYLKIAFGLVVVAGLMAVMAGPALAETYRWVGCTENKEKGQWEDSKCEKAKSGGNWETKEPATGTEVTTATIPGTSGLELEDKKAGTAIKCKGGGAGKLNATATGELTAASATKCEFVKAGSCEATKPVTAKAIHLPWKTKVEEVNKERRNVIENSGAGEPGYSVECTVGGIFKITDTCEGKTNTSITNRTSASGGEGTVEGEFDAKSPTGKCSVGGAEQGRTAGAILLRLKGVSIIWWRILGLLDK